MRPLFALALVAHSALAHKGSDAYLTLQPHGAIIDGRLDVALKDLDVALGLDVNGDRALSWSEVVARSSELNQLLEGSIRVEHPFGRCATHFESPALVRHSDGAYAAVQLSAVCPAAVASIQLHYDLLFDVDSTHRGLVSLGGQDEGWVALTTGARERELSWAPVEPVVQFVRALEQGAHHLAAGWDHLCFLAALLLPSVLYRSGRTWQAQPALRPAARDVLLVATAFTVAHSLTLGLASFHLVTPNAKIVEVAIALSVGLAGLNNLAPFVPDARWALAFSLGLLHGFGFVSAVSALGVSGPLRVISIAGFNLGIELGQIALIGLFVPLAWAMRASRFYRRIVLPLGSLVIVGFSLWWVVERVN